MPRTPWAWRPIGRTFSSSKRIALPSCVARKTIWLPSVQLAATSSSSFSMAMALMPIDRTLLKSFNGVFLTVPLRVAKKTYLPSSSRSRTVSNARMLSPGCVACAIEGGVDGDPEIRLQMDGDAQVLGHGLAKECGELVRVGIGGINPTSGKEGGVVDLRGRSEERSVG